jgi:hypothetical protein
MATIQALWTTPVGGVSRAVFTPMTFSGTDVTADVLFAPEFSSKEVQVFGTFGAGGSVTVEGSLDGGTTWATLADVQGNALTFTAARLEKIQETTARLRARVTAGDGTTSLTVVFVLVSGGCYGS